MPPIPSGPDAAHPTRILGAGWDTGCADPPELWGTERADVILNLTGASNVEIGCLEITDHSSCVEFHTGGAGLRAGYRSLRRLGRRSASTPRIRRTCAAAIWTSTGSLPPASTPGRLTDWTVENVRIAGNGWVGWDGDIDGGDSNAGAHWSSAAGPWSGTAAARPSPAASRPAAGRRGPAATATASAPARPRGTGSSRTRPSCTTPRTAWTCSTSLGRPRCPGPRPRRGQCRQPGQGDRRRRRSRTACWWATAPSSTGKPFTYDVDPCRALGNTLEVVYTGGEHSAPRELDFLRPGGRPGGWRPARGVSMRRHGTIDRAGTTSSWETRTTSIPAM